MEKVWNSIVSIKNWIVNHSKQILFWCFVILVICLWFSIKSCTSEKDQNKMLKHNIEALTDTIHEYKGKNGELIASKKLLEGDISLLKITNEDLYTQLESMKKKDATQVVHTDNTITFPTDSTTWDITHEEPLDTIIEHYNFNFNNQWRKLEGYVSHGQSQLGVNITKDEVYFDYTVAIKDNEVFITSTNPYIKYNEVTGIVLPKTIQKKKHWMIGPSISGGYDIINHQWGMNVGVSVTYGIISF